MGDRMHEHYRRVDPQYYQEHAPDYTSYGGTQSVDPNYSQEHIYGGQERMQYVQYDPNYVYHNDQANMAYQAQQNEQANMGYAGHPNGQARMGYQQQGADQAMMGYANYQRDYYNQQRNMMAQNYAKTEAQEMNSVNQGMRMPGVNYGMNYYNNMMYYSQPNRIDGRPEFIRPDMYGERNFDFMANKTLFKPSLTFKEAATAMLSMESVKKTPVHRPKSSRARGGLKSFSKTPRIPSNNTDVSSTKSEGGSVDYTYEPGYDAEAAVKDPSYLANYIAIKSNRPPPPPPPRERSKPEPTHERTRYYDHDFSRYKNKGLEQLSQYNQIYGQTEPLTGYSALVSRFEAAAAQQPADGTQPAQIPIYTKLMYPRKGAQHQQPVNDQARDWVAMKKVHPNVIAASTRYYQPTPQPMPNVRNDAVIHKMNVVEEISIENNLMQNLKRSTISAASSLMESFQQSFSNKRKRIKNCLVEDCRHLIGEQPKIDVQFSSLEIDGEKKYLLSDVVSTLLPYHLFYYKEIKPKSPTEFDYTDVSNQIDNLEQELEAKLMDQTSDQVHDGYSCVKEGLITCSELVFNSGQDRSDI